MKTRPPREAILLVAFGASDPLGQKTYDQIEAQTGSVFPGIEIRRAYTSRTIRSKLAREGQHCDSPQMALVRMMEDGFSKVSILSLHLIPGKEYHELCHNARLYAQMRGGFDRVSVARPLLSSHADRFRVAKALLRRVPKGRNPREEAVLFMGHGTRNHPADAVYAAMNCILQDLDPNAFVGTMDGYPSLDALVEKLGRKEIRKVYLMPLLAVAGGHVRNDMMGDKPESWKSVLTRSGFQCVPIPAGVAEYAEIVEVWMDHLRDAFSEQ